MVHSKGFFVQSTYCLFERIRIIQGQNRSKSTKSLAQNFFVSQAELFEV